MKIGSFRGKVDLALYYKENPKGDQAVAELTKTFIEFAFKESMDRVPFESFNFLLTTKLEGSAFHFGLTCHVEPFFKSYKEIFSLFFSNQKAWKDRVADLPEVADLRCKLGLGNFVPHRITLTEQNVIDIDCIQQNLYTPRFPINTSSLLLLISALIQGKMISFDDFGVKKLEPKEEALVHLLLDIQKGKRDFKFDDFDIDTSNPENWSLYKIK